MHAYILLLVYLLLSYPRSMASLFITAFRMMSEVDDNFHDFVGFFFNLVFNGNRDASQHKLYYDLGDVLKLIKNGKFRGKFCARRVSSCWPPFQVLFSHSGVMWVGKIKEKFPMIYRGGVIRKIRNAEGGGRGLSVALRSYLKAWVKCGKRVTIGGRG